MAHQTVLPVTRIQAAAAFVTMLILLLSPMVWLIRQVDGVTVREERINARLDKIEKIDAQHNEQMVQTKIAIAENHKDIQRIEYSICVNHAKDPSRCLVTAP